MPELPEVETIARQLRSMVVGRTVSEFRSEWVRLTEPEPAELFAKRLAGRRIEDVRRRGKFVVFDLSGGDALVVSLRMTGRFLFRSAEQSLPHDPAHRNGDAYCEAAGRRNVSSESYIRGTLTFADGTSLAYSDTRKFGRMALVDVSDLPAPSGAAPRPRRVGEPLYAMLGMEPLSRGFTVRWLTEFLKRRARAAIKPLLLDQRGIAGIGNIYAIEALWRARIHPLRNAGSLRADEVARLYEALRWVLRKGIRFGGASRRDYRDARGNEGRMQQEFRVYGRVGEPCPRCGRAIVRTVVGGRGTFHCTRCQRAPKAI